MAKVQFPDGAVATVEGFDCISELVKPKVYHTWILYILILVELGRSKACQYWLNGRIPLIIVMSFNLRFNDLCPGIYSLIISTCSSCVVPNLVR